ncbi:MAG: hypothetical protein KDA51_15545 [Planctomycetales bacterium]|nr:hypothetical protein [Planctomycetales bacterium]
MLPAPKYFAQLPNPLVLQIVGADAAKVVNNMSTNDLAKLPVDAALESFVTDVRGWVVAHVGVLKQVDRVWLLGSHATPSALVNHIDRYIIREDAAVSDVSQKYALFIIGDGPQLPVDEGTDGRASDANAIAVQPTAGRRATPITTPSLFTCECSLPVFGQGTRLLCCPSEQAARAIERLRASGSEFCSAQRFEWLRISSFWPLHPADIGDKTIPQELDRDRQAISFTKGCYLGQETIARLDARGQLQKKLCLIELTPSREIAIGATLYNGEKEVGHITSLARDPASGSVRALAILRRGNFAAGTQLTGNGFEAQVLP